MKFRDKDGHVFEDIESAGDAFCRTIDRCNDCCPLKMAYKTDSASWCLEWETAHPAEAAQLMGYEIIREPGVDFPMPEYEPKEVAFRRKDSVDKQSTVGQANQPGAVNCGSSKPRICEVLGVEVEERFGVKHEGENWFYFNQAGTPIRVSGHDKIGECLAIAINHPDRIIRKPRFTEAEVADARAIMRIFGEVGIIARGAEGDAFLLADAKQININDRFPSIPPGQSVMLGEIVGDEE